VAQTALRVVEELNLDATAIELSAQGERFSDNPGVVLVDLWCLAMEERKQELIGAIRGLPPWVGVVVLFDRDDPQLDDFGRDLADNLPKIFADIGRPFSVADDLAAFSTVMTELVVHTQATFLRDGPSFPPSGPPVPLLRAYPTKMTPPAVPIEIGRR
jgi:hypothetical protein